MNAKNVQNPNVDTLVGGLEFGTMEFYDFPFSWEFQKIPTDDSVHHFSEGLAATTNQLYILGFFGDPRNFPK